MAHETPGALVPDLFRRWWTAFHFTRPEIYFFDLHQGNVSR
jgi:hypothetical protein